MPRIVSRAEWGARKPRTPFATVPIATRAATCVHHDGATPILVHTFAEACARVRTDEAYHMNHNGWAGIGYNYLVISAPGVAGVDGLIFEARGRDAIGAHCLNHNTEWLGIQVAIGGGQVPSPAALASVRWLHDTCQQAAGHALGKKVHSDGFATACPGPILKTWVHSGMPVTATPSGDVPMSAAEVKTITTAIANHEKNELARYSSAGDRYADLVRREAAQTAQITALTATVRALAAGQKGVEPAVLLAAVTAAVKASLANLSITLKTVP